jgi:hypothetical protein
MVGSLLWLLADAGLGVAAIVNVYDQPLLPIEHA